MPRTAESWDQEARISRDLFAAEADFLSAPFAARLKAFLQQHIALRSFYPEVERFYGAVQRGHLEQPLPQDAVEGVGRTVRENTPRVFEPEVSSELREVERQAPPLELAADEIRHAPGAVLPPPDPLGKLEPTKSHSFSVASALNSLWKTFLEGKDLPEAVEGWNEVAQQLAPYMASIIEWLKLFRS